MNKKGFTLIELLVVIIIIGTLSTLLVPSIMNVFKKSKYKTFKESTKSVIRAADNYLADKNYDIEDGTCYDINDGKINLKIDSSIKNGMFCIINSQPFLKHVTDGNLCASGNANSLDTYKCGEKSIVLFSARYLENNNTPYKKIPDVAFIIPKGDKLDKYINSYYKTYLDSINSYNFWDSYNLSSVPINWDKDFNNDTIVNNDIKYSINSIRYINNVENTITNNTYNIISLKDQLINIGYDDDVIGENIVQTNSLKNWILKNDGYNNFTISTPSEIYIGYSQADIGTKLFLNNVASKYQLQLLNDGSFIIHPYDNTDYCLAAEKKSFKSDNNLQIENCDANDVTQKFLFKKVN